MLKKILKAIRRLIKREVARYRFAREKQEHRKRWAHLMHIGNTVHAEDKPLQVNYLDGRMMGQRGVTPQFYDPELWKLFRKGVAEDSNNPNCDNDRSKLSTTESGASDNAGVGPCSVD